MARGDVHLSNADISGSTTWWVTPPSGEDWGVRNVRTQRPYGGRPNTKAYIQWGVGNGTDYSIWEPAAAVRHLGTRALVMWDPTREGYLYNTYTASQILHYAAVEL